MTATERLRAMLDERGVGWRKAPHYSSESQDNETIFEGNGIEWHANDHMNGRLGLRALKYEVTPEQAIEATLGRGECGAEVEVVEFSQMQEIHRFTCSECGESFGAEEHGGLFGLVLDKVKLPNYCPNCGRAVRA